MTPPQNNFNKSRSNIKPGSAPDPDFFRLGFLLSGLQHSWSAHSDTSLCFTRIIKQLIIIPLYAIVSIFKIWNIMRRDDAKVYSHLLSLMFYGLPKIKQTIWTRLTFFMTPPSHYILFFIKAKLSYSWGLSVVWVRPGTVRSFFPINIQFILVFWIRGRKQFEGIFFPISSPCKSL